MYEILFSCLIFIRIWICYIFSYDTSHWSWTRRRLNIAPKSEENTKFCRMRFIARKSHLVDTVLWRIIPWNIVCSFDVIRSDPCSLEANFQLEKKPFLGRETWKSCSAFKRFRFFLFVNNSVCLFFSFLGNCHRKRWFKNYCNKWKPAIKPVEAVLFWKYSFLSVRWIHWKQWPCCSWGMIKKVIVALLYSPIRWSWNFIVAITKTFGWPCFVM